MNNYITFQEAAKKWDLTPRRIQILCNEERIDGAVKISKVWLIPASAPKPAKQTKIAKNEKRKSNINVLSLFSGCGGMDLGFEGNFEVLAASVNKKVNPQWDITKIDANWVKLPKTRFHTVFANDIREDAKKAWTNYFGNRGISSSTYCLDSIVDLVKLHKENGVKIFPKNIDIVTGGFPCQDFSIAGKRLGFDSDKSHKGKKLNDDTPSGIVKKCAVREYPKYVIGIYQAA